MNAINHIPYLYLKGWRPLKTEFLCGQRVRRLRDGEAHGVIWVGQWTDLANADWILFRSYDGHTTCLRVDQVQHLPFTRGPL